MILEPIKAFRDKIFGLNLAYRRVFSYENQYTKTVLKDLAKFCRAHETTFLPDARAHAVLEGRREVWLRIEQNLRLNPDQLYELHKIKEIMPDPKGVRSES